MKLDRMIGIIMILLERETVPAKELAETFEVSLRTIYRDLDSISQAGIPVAALSGPGNGVSILKSYKVEKRLFSTSDVANMLMALGSVQDSLPGKEILHTLAKVKGMISEEKKQEIDFKASQIKIDLSPWLYADNLSEKLEAIKNAVEQQQHIQFDYRSNRNNKTTSRKLEPYRLVLKSEDWYLQGFCLVREDFRTFKILRMKNLKSLDTTFTARPFPEEAMSRPQFQDEIIIPVTLRIHEDVRDMILSRFGESCLSPDGNEHYIARVHMPPEDLAIRYLLSMGTKCQCLDPPEMRTKLRDMAEEIYLQHR